jgi:hypothetical protein
MAPCRLYGRVHVARSLVQLYHCILVVLVFDSNVLSLLGGESYQQLYWQCDLSWRVVSDTPQQFVCTWTVQ